MKKGWQTKTLGELLAVLRNGVNCKQDRSGSGDKVSRIESISDATFDIERVGYAQLREQDKERFRLQHGDILFSHINSAIHVGKTAVFDSDEEVYHGVNLLLMRPSSEVTSSYLEHSLKFLFQTGYWRGVCKQSVNQASVNQQDISRVRVSFPISLEEQQRIVGLLDEAFASLATAQAHAAQNLQNARDLFESHLNAVFTQRGEGWVEKTLGDVCEFLNGFAFKSGDAVPVSQTQLLRMGNLYCNRLDLDRSPVFYPDDFAAEYSRYVLAEGEIIMSLTGTSGKEDYGFAVRIPDCGHILLMNQRLMKFDAIRQDIIDDGYLLHYLRSRCFLNVLYPTANGTRQANLSSATMKLLPVPLPSMNEQKCIAGKLDALSADTQCLTQIYEQKLGALAALKKSLLHQAFSGEL